MSASPEVDAKEAGAKRRRWPEALKRELVGATLEPGASVSIVARRHDVNANQLFKWRRRFAGSLPMPALEPVELVPVAIAPESPPASEAVVGARPASMAAPRPLAGSIEIALSGGVRVKIKGSVDPAAVSAAMRALMTGRRRR